MAARMAAGTPCDGMDPQQPVLCHQHCADPGKTFEAVKLPTLSLPAVVQVLELPPVRRGSCRVAAAGRPPRPGRLRTRSSSPRSDSESDPLRRLTGAGAARPHASRVPVRPRSLSCQDTSCAQSPWLPPCCRRPGPSPHRCPSTRPSSLAVQRSQLTRVGARRCLERRRDGACRRPAGRPDAERRHRQPAGDRRQPVQHQRRGHDDEAHRHRPGMGIGREASRPRSRRAGRGTGASR